MECLNCGGMEIAKGIIEGRTDDWGSGPVFKPDGLRFLALTMQHGPKFGPESYACLNCGLVWSQTDPEALRKFIRKHCKRGKGEEPQG